MINIFAAQAADGSSSTHILNSESEVSKIGINAWGAFGGGTITLEVSPDGGTTWIPVATYTVNKSEVIEVAGKTIRATLAGATAPSINLDVTGKTSNSTTQVDS